jgi:hypothetical protein
MLGATPVGAPMALFRKLLFGISWATGGVLALGLTLIVQQGRSAPDLYSWHDDSILERDFSRRDEASDLSAYRAHEARVFASLSERIPAPGETLRPVSRYHAQNPLRPRDGDFDWNRTFVLETDGAARGAALLLHGLSDSPYSMRALGQWLVARGYLVVGLRMPGHGTTPGALRSTRWRDWRAAVQLAARDAASRVRDGSLIVVGYSTGAALATEYALTALEDDSLPRASNLILFAPAIGVPPIAALAPVQKALAALPGLEKLGWTGILPEYDPYKYNSFPVEAGIQVRALTLEIADRIDALAARGGLAAFPPVLAFETVVDATIVARSIAGGLLDRLPANASELVLFDVNHAASADDLIRPGPRALLELIEAQPSDRYHITVLTNSKPRSPEVAAREHAAGSAGWTSAATGLAWPTGVYALSHVSLPFRPDDPLYGVRQGDRMTLGSLELRGERGVLVLSDENLMRLRYNPFWSYIEARLSRTLGVD